MWFFPSSWCKTQNSGLRSKEEKLRYPINHPSTCNTQEGLLSFAQMGDSDLGGRAHRTANWASFICSMLHTGYKVIGYMFAKQSYWYELRGLLFKFKAILLVQTARAFHWVHIDWPAPGHPMGAPASPGPLPAPAPAAPHNKTFFSQLQKPTRKISDT